MNRTIRPGLRGLLLAAVAALAIACSPGTYGAPAAPAGSVAPAAPARSAAPVAASTAPAPVAPAASDLGGGYSY
jgi:hypothetical protein